MTQVQKWVDERREKPGTPAEQEARKLLVQEPFFIGARNLAKTLLDT